MDILKYKNYEGTSELDMDNFVCRGKILFIDDLVTYETDSPKKLQQEFEAAVDDYIETCEFLGREPKKPLKGQFNIRISPTLHKQAVIRALKDNIYLNDVICRAVDNYVNAQPEINQHITVKNEDPRELQTLLVAQSSNVEWLGGEGRVN